MYTGLTGALGLSIPKEEGSQSENSQTGKFFSARIGYISGWSVEDKTEIIESTKVGQVHKEALPGFQSWSASADGAVVFEDNGGHEALFAAKHKGDKIILHFYLKDMETAGTVGKDVYFQGEGYIESLSVDLSAGDKGNISISIRGNGALNLFVDGKNVKDGSAAIALIKVPPCLLTRACAIKFEIIDGNLNLTYSGGESPRYEIINGELVCNSQ